LLEPITAEHPCGQNLEDTALLASFDGYRLYGRTKPLDAVTGELVTGPEIVTRGWVYAPEAEELLEEAKAAVRESLHEAADEGAIDFETLRRHARRSLGKFINERTRRRPAIIPVVIEV